MFDTFPQLDCAGRTVRLDLPRVMGIVNVTPDSFSDGGAHFDVEAAIAHGLRLADEGADILDIGGESTRPGADEVPAEEELRRVIPVIQALAKATTLAISIDTSKPKVGNTHTTTISNNNSCAAILGRLKYFFIVAPLRCGTGGY